MTAKIFYIFVLASFYSVYSIAQVQDNFGDGDFTSYPAWRGDTENFIISAQELQLVASGAGTSMLSTTNNYVSNSTWTFKIELEFNPSSSNYVRVYLVSNTSNLADEVSGYFVMIGGTPDEVSLYRQDGSNTTKIIDGIDGTLNTASVMVEVKVERDDSGNWELYSDPTSSGSYNLEGTATDAAYITSKYFSIFCRYTLTRSDKFLFDDISVTQQTLPDTNPPHLDSAVIISTDSVKLYFNEKISFPSFNPLNFSIDGVSPSLVNAANSDSTLIELLFPNQFTNGYEYRLVMNNISDTLGNISEPIETDVLYFRQLPVNYRDVVINEIMADPNPTEDLPEIEYVEIFNSSSNPVQLMNWTFSDATTSSIIGSYILLPDSFLILSEDTTQFSSFGGSLELHPWPTLNNSGDELNLSSPTAIIDSVSYESLWYQDFDKDNGGWSLEQISDTLNCLGSHNWAASLNPQGGTPGKSNSSFLPENITPQLNEIAILSSDSILVNFNQPMDWSQSYDVLIDGYDSSFGTSNQLLVLLNPSLVSDLTYSIELQGFANCAGSPMPAYNGTIFMDKNPPELEAIEFIYHNEITLIFSDTLALTSMSEKDFSLDNEAPGKVVYESKFTLHLEFDTLINGVSYNLQYSVSDNSGNFTAGSVTVIYESPYSPVFGDIIINEVLPDPVPAQGLPEEEFIEIYNRSGFRIPLSQFTISDPTKTGRFPRSYIEDGAYLILCKSGKTHLFENLGPVIGISNWPSLNSSKETLELNFFNKVIHQIEYEQSWYYDDEKQDGGWSLEIIDPEDYCGGEDNWLASANQLGGTPGALNSVDADKPDLLPPLLNMAVALDSVNVQVQFDEKILQSGLSLQSFLITPNAAVRNK